MLKNEVLLSPPPIPVHLRHLVGLRARLEKEKAAAMLRKKSVKRSATYAISKPCRERPDVDFSHLRPAMPAVPVLRVPSPVNDFRPTELGSSDAKEAAALAMSKQILEAGRRAQLPTDSGVAEPTGLAAAIIAAGQKRRGLTA